MILFLFCTVISLCALLLLLEIRRPPKYPPGPKFLPIFGNFFLYRKMYKAYGYHHLVWLEMSKHYGDVVGLKLGRIRIVAVFGPEAIKEVLNREDFNGRPDGFFFRLRTFGKRLGVVFSDGPLWKKQRKFSLQHLRHFGYGRKEMEEKIHEEVKSLIGIFESGNSEPLHMHNAFDVSVLNVLWAMMAGERFQTDDQRLRKLLQIIHDAFRIVDMSGGMLNQLPFLRHFAPDAVGYTQVMDVLKRMWEFLEESISDHRSSVSYSQQPRDLIDAFLQQMNVTNDSTFTDDQLMSLLLDLFMAGAETTSNSLGFAMLFMVRHPDIQKKIRDELDREVGRDRWPTLSDKIRLKYTEAVLMEIQRRVSVAPSGIAHRAMNDTELFGYRIPKDTMILTSLYSIHMDETYWGDPSEFRPERFLDESGELIVNEKYYMPFGTGKRRCLGESLGKANIFLFFTAMIHKFYIENGDDILPDVKGYDGVTIAPKPFRVKLIPRTT